MEYVNILSLVMDSDEITTNGFKSLFHNVTTDMFVDSSMISDEPIVKKVRDNRFLCLYRENGYVVLDYFTGGTGSIKSCTKKIKLEFATEVINKLFNLQADEICSLADDILDYRQLIMIATSYNLQRDKVDPNHIIEQEEYTNYYFLRKNQKNHYYLQSEIWPTKPIQHNNSVIDSTVLYFDILPTFQRMLNPNKSRTSLTDLEELKEIKNIEDLKGLYDFDDIDEDDDDFDYYDEEDINNDDFTR